MSEYFCNGINLTHIFINKISIELEMFKIYHSKNGIFIWNNWFDIDFNDSYIGFNFSIAVLNCVIFSVSIWKKREGKVS